MGPRSRPSSHHGWLGLLVLCLALVPRLLPLQHGAPHGFERDADVPHAALVMLRDRDPAPPRYLYTAEPYLCAYLSAPIFAARYALGKARGEWAGAEGFAGHLAAQPLEERLAGRLLAALLGALAPWIAWALLREAGLGRGALAAAALLALDPFHVHLSTQARTLAPFLTLLLAAALFALRHARTGRTAPLVGATVCAALAHAAREVPTGAVVLGLPGLAWWASPLGWRGAELQRRLRMVLLMGLLFVAVAVPLGYPFLLTHPREAIPRALIGLWLRASGSFFAQGELLFSPRGFVATLDLRAAGALVAAFCLNTPVLAGCALLGVAPALLQGAHRRASGPVTVFGLLWALVYLTHRNGHVADGAPLLVLLLPAAAIALEAVMRLRLLRGAFVLALAASAATTGKLVHVSMREDTRVAVERWLTAEGTDLPGRAVVAVDAFGPAPRPSQSALERIAALRAARGEGLHGREAQRLAALRAGHARHRGVDVLPVEEVLQLDYWDSPLAGLACRDGRRRAAWVHSTGAAGEYVAWSAGVRRAFVWPGARYRLIPEVSEALGLGAPQAAQRSALAVAAAAHAALRAAGATHVVLASFGPAGEEPHVLAAGLPPPLHTVDPGGEARLPFDLESGWLGVWRADRPGPRLAVHALD